MTIGKPPPNTMSRGVWVIPCRSGGSSLMKSNQAWVGHRERGGGVGLVLRNLDRQFWRAVHAGEGLEIAALVGDRDAHFEVELGRLLRRRRDRLFRRFGVDAVLDDGHPGLPSFCRAMGASAGRMIRAGQGVNILRRLHQAYCRRRRLCLIPEGPPPLPQRRGVTPERRRLAAVARGTRALRAGGRSCERTCKKACAKS